MEASGSHSALILGPSVFVSFGTFLWDATFTFPHAARQPRSRHGRHALASERPVRDPEIRKRIRKRLCKHDGLYESMRPERDSVRWGMMGCIEGNPLLSPMARDHSAKQ